MRYILIKDGIIENNIELDPDNVTTTFIRHVSGHKYPTTVIDGETFICNKYIPPQGYQLIQSDMGETGQAWPLAEPDSEDTPPD